MEQIEIEEGIKEAVITENKGDSGVYLNGGINYALEKQIEVKEGIKEAVKGSFEVQNDVSFETGIDYIEMPGTLVTRLKYGCIALTKFGEKGEERITVPSDLKFKLAEFARKERERILEECIKFPGRYLG